jgi:hypothetical protein
MAFKGAKDPLEGRKNHLPGIVSSLPPEGRKYIAN